MTHLNKKKIVLVVLGILLIVQIIWFAVTQHYVNKTQTKTTATVIRLESLGDTCTSAKYCDHSDRTYPVYEYYELQGKRYEQDDQFFGDFKQNNPLRFLFGKDVGDRVTAYYTKDKPKEILFMGGIFSYAPWFAPIYFVVILAFPVGVIFLVIKLRKIMNVVK